MWLRVVRVGATCSIRSRFRQQGAALARPIAFGLDTTAVDLDDPLAECLSQPGAAEAVARVMPDIESAQTWYNTSYKRLYSFLTKLQAPGY